jgi:esterase/lipase
MSWVEQIKTEFIIKTGDGLEYGKIGTFPILWVNPQKEVEYNIAEFQFPELAGTLVKRGTPRGRRYPLEFYFQGENHLDQSARFEKSANDPRPWTITHPYYGTIICEPVSLNFDNTGDNVTKITGTVIETIVEDNPKTSVNPTDKIKSDHLDTTTKFNSAFATNVKPDGKSIRTLSSNTTKVYNEGKKKARTTVNAEKYFNLYNTANAAILQATSKPLEAIRAIQAMISYPSMFVDGVKNRIKTIINQIDKLRTSIDTLTSKADKKIYEHNAGVSVASLALTAVVTKQDTITEASNDITDLQLDPDSLADEKPVTDYANKKDVLDAIDNILDSYSGYLSDLDSLQSDNAGDIESYIPDADSLIALNDLINYTVSNLFDVALNAKQERSIILEQDSNVVLLAHRFYGLKSDDSTIDELIRNNNIGTNELLHIRKGRKIIYYV